jgi:hypothetical protein
LRYSYCATTQMDAWLQFEAQFPPPHEGVNLDCKKADRAPPGLHPESGGVCMCDGDGTGGGGGSDGAGVGGSFGDGVGGSFGIGAGAGPSSSDVGAGAGPSSSDVGAAVGAGAGSSLPPGWGGAGGAW